MRDGRGMVKESSAPPPQEDPPVPGRLAGTPPSSTAWAIPLADSGLTVRVLDAQDLTVPQQHEVIELLRIAFNGGPGWFRLPVEPIEHLQWKFLDPPHESRAYLIEDEGRLVGFGGRFYRRWLLQGVERIVRTGGEAALHPDYQGRRLSSLRRAAMRDQDGDEDMILSFSSHPTSLHNQSKNGSAHFGRPLDNLLRPLRLSAFLASSKPRGQAGPQQQPEPSSRTRIAMEQQRRRLPRNLLARQVAWRARMVRHRLHHPPLRFPEGSWTIRTVEAFDARVGGFFEQASREFDFIQSRTAEQLNWRYTDPRGGPFSIRIAEQADAILGYTVFRATAAGADLADLLALPGRLDVAHALVVDAVRCASQAQAPAIRAWMMDAHPYHHLLTHNGFLPNRRIVLPGFRLSRLQPEAAAVLSDPACRVHLMLGDSDHV